MNKVQTNNTNLQTILDTVNALPDAGSGGGGGSVETCTVTITSSYSKDIEVFYVTVVNDEISYSSINLFTGQSKVINSVLCGSIMVINAANATIGWSLSNTNGCVSLLVATGGTCRAVEIYHDIDSASMTINPSLDDI